MYCAPRCLPAALHVTETPSDDLGTHWPENRHKGRKTRIRGEGAHTIIYRVYKVWSGQKIYEASSWSLGQNVLLMTQRNCV